MSLDRVVRASTTIVRSWRRRSKPPPKKYGVTHWSSRLLGRHLGISNGTIARAWRDLRGRAVAG